MYENKESVIVVNISSNPDTGHYDKTCILGKRDHGFIKHDSYVVYKHAQIMTVKDLEKNFNNKIEYKGNMNKNLIGLICEGLEKSKYTRKKIKSFYKNCAVISPKHHR